MKKRFAFTKGRLIGFIFSALIPAIIIGLGVFNLTKGVVLDLAFSTTFIFLPLIAMGLLALCIFSGCKPFIKVILCGPIIFLFMISCIFSFAFLGYTQVKHYEGAEARLQYADETSGNILMPELSEIGQPTDVEYHNVFISTIIFSAETDYLICHYSPDEYAIQKTALETKYTFQKDSMGLYSSICEPSAEVGGYLFRLLSIEEYKNALDYPKCLTFIGYSDDAREIVYVSFYDIELDYIPSFKEFIVDDCGWKHIR